MIRANEQRRGELFATITSFVLYSIPIGLLGVQHRRLKTK